MAEISIDKPFSTNQLPSGFLKVPTPPIDGTPQSVEDLTGAISNLKLATDQSEFVSALEQCALLLRTSVAGSGISFVDSTTSSDDQVGVGAFGDLLCLRGGGNGGGTVRVGSTFVDFQNNTIRNFKANVPSISSNLVINSTNEQTYNGSVLLTTTTTSVTIDTSVANGFNLSIIQQDANQVTISTSGALTLRNRQGHTKTAGQYATITLLKNSTNLYLAGDTA
jgi:hypothetical protein